MGDEIEIKPLSEQTLAEASKLTLDVFHLHEDDEDYPPKSLKASLYPKENKDYYEDLDVTNLKYWVAVDSNNHVLGIIGYYTLKYDEKEAYWVGWYCVNPESRGKGVGRLLLNLIINKTKDDGKKWLRLYTSNEPNEKIANKIYDKLGFKSIKDKKINEMITSEKFRDFTKDLVYKELRLN